MELDDVRVHDLDKHRFVLFIPSSPNNSCPQSNNSSATCKRRSNQNLMPHDRRRHERRTEAHPKIFTMHALMHAWRHVSA
eukprot:CAMPEP_0179177516 /NCGR_PEP_ID=MMETSP0796-20121207/87791_1 /TAXON_ID=73915 /ORGANISM="Pyrodinium bahamense, Strain pbaha01" /LENGTH=79 /DNA_ID=CAMNT_0020881071 /DNA_START=294 /DNA_END=529 /DNA_ORIENTATION=-